MNGEGVLLDSVILIDHLNGIASATDFLKETGRRGYISAITRAEVLTGVPPTRIEAVRQLLDAFSLIPIDGTVADLAAEFRKSFRLKLPDALQAAAAVHHGLKLATRNTKDFSPRRFDFILVPYAI